MLRDSSITLLLTITIGFKPLCLGLQGEDCATTHTVVAGDGCWQIANDAGTDLNTLFANNPNVAEDCSNIYPGEVLCVAPEVVVI
jgi:hypothetical protein